MILLSTLFIAMSLSSSKPTVAPECGWKKLAREEFELTLEKRSLKIDVDGGDAQLLKCNRWPETKNTWVVEVDLGTTGSTAEGHSIDLFIVTLKNDRLTSLLRKNVEDVTKGYDNEKQKNYINRIRNDYKLEAPSKGKLRLRWSDGSTTELDASASGSN